MIDTLETLFHIGPPSWIKELVVVYTRRVIMADDLDVNRAVRKRTANRSVSKNLLNQGRDIISNTIIQKIKRKHETI